MEPDWLKQTKDTPLFSDLLWSRPENKNLAGKLLIIGGNLHGFAAPAEAYVEAIKAGVGSVRVVLPDKLQKMLGNIIETAYFEPSTPSGSLSKAALAGLLEHALWADAVLIAGDLGRNSETAIVLESFLQKFSGQVTITKDSADYFTKSPGIVLFRKDTLFVISFAQLQKMASKAHFPEAFTFDMDVFKLVKTLRTFTQQFSVKIVVKHLDTFFVAERGRVSSTKLSEEMEIWRVPIASHAAIWWLQNPAKSFEAITSSLIAV